MTKNLYIAVAFAACVLFGGAAVFHYSEAGVFAAEALAFVGGYLLLHFLDDRQYRREREEQKLEEIRRRLRV